MTTINIASRDMIHGNIYYTSGIKIPSGLVMSFCFTLFLQKIFAMSSFLAFYYTFIYIGVQNIVNSLNVKYNN
jgi:hypothetical protein